MLRDCSSLLRTCVQSKGGKKPLINALRSNITLLPSDRHCLANEAGPAAVPLLRFHLSRTGANRHQKPYFAQS